MTKAAGKAVSLGISSQSYGEKYSEHLFEQYRLLVESAEKVSERRKTANEFYLGVNAFLVACFGIEDKVAGQSAYGLSAILGFGIVTCLLWFVALRSYRQLNSTKFSVILELEELLPARPFGNEWEIVGAQRGTGYVRMSRIEQWMPIAIAGFYVLIALGMYLGLLKW